ncbi:MAG: cell division protein FtsZ [Candidatus Eisenbacteria bacterium]
MIQFEIENVGNARMKVIGVGGAGNNAVNRMIFSNLQGVEFVAVNTDCQALTKSSAGTKIQIGSRITKGLGSGGDPDIGRRAAEEDRDVMSEVVDGADMVFITAGMGGGTGTGASPVVAEIAKGSGALTVAIVTKPFAFEGRRRMEQAQEGINELKRQVDTVIGIPNQKLLQVVAKDTPLLDAFALADEILLKATRGISDLITIPGEINLDFADVRTIMSEMGDAIMGTGSASGDDRAKEAANRALRSPLLDDVSIAGAKGLLINVTGGPLMSLSEISDAANTIYDAAGSEANVIFGTAIDETLNDEIRVTVIATGIGKSSTEDRSALRDHSEPGRISNGFLQRAFKRRDIPEVDNETRVSVDACLDVDYETPAFMRRHSD